jgi:hypothetical protein
VAQVLSRNVEQFVFKDLRLLYHSTLGSRVIKRKRDSDARTPLHLAALAGREGVAEVLSTPYTIHSTPFTLHHSPYTLHPTPYTQNPYTRNLYTRNPKFEPRNPKPKPRTPEPRTPNIETGQGLRNSVVA